MSDFLRALQSASESDLSAVESRMDELSRELDALKTARKVLMARLGKQEEAKPKSSSLKGSKLAEMIFDVISSEGPNTSDAIARKLASRGHKVSAQAVGVSAGRSEWFVKLDSGKIAIATTNGAA